MSVEDRDYILNIDEDMICTIQLDQEIIDVLPRYWKLCKDQQYNISEELFIEWEFLTGYLVGKLIMPMAISINIEMMKQKEKEEKT
jgi:hypothetical protein